MTLEDAMRAACATVGVVPPARLKVGNFIRTNTLEANGKGDATVLIFDDRQGGVVTNWQTQQKLPFSIRQQGEAPAPKPRDYAAERRAEAKRLEVERICDVIVKASSPTQHPYFAKKGFPDAKGLVCENVLSLLPNNDVAEGIAYAVPKSEAPLLIVPGRIGKRLTTVQFITVEGEKVNIKGGQMSGACYRIASGRETWVCEGIATAMSVRDALRLLGRSATVLSAFAAANVAKVATAASGAILAADNDKPLEALGGYGTGQYYAVRSGRKWVMPPERGDFNDMHQREGLRAVAMHLREIGMS